METQHCTSASEKKHDTIRRQKAAEPMVESEAPQQVVTPIVPGRNRADLNELRIKRYYGINGILPRRMAIIITSRLFEKLFIGINYICCECHNYEGKQP